MLLHEDREVTRNCPLYKRGVLFAFQSFRCQCQTRHLSLIQTHLCHFSDSYNAGRKGTDNRSQNDREVQRIVNE